MKKFISFILVLTFISPAQAEKDIDLNDFDPDVSHWIEIKRPENNLSPEGGVFTSSANFSKLNWKVREDEGTIKASLNELVPKEKPKFTPKTPQFNGGHRFKKVEDGWLVGFNEGEFGGELWWFSNNGQSSYKISDDQINQFIFTNRSIFAIQGLAHLGSRRGSLIKIDKKDGRWVSTQKIDFGESPEAIIRMADNWFAIVLTNSLVRVDENYNVAKVLEDAHWGTFYPNSIASNSPQLVYVGMRQYVVEINLKTRKARYLIPGKKYLNKLPPEQEERIREQYRDFSKILEKERSE